TEARLRGPSPDAGVSAEKELRPIFRSIFRSPQNLGIRKGVGSLLGSPKVSKRLPTPFLPDVPQPSLPIKKALLAPSARVTLLAAPELLEGADTEGASYIRSRPLFFPARSGPGA